MVLRRARVTRTGAALRRGSGALHARAAGVLVGRMPVRVVVPGLEEVRVAGEYPAGGSDVVVGDLGTLGGEVCIGIITYLQGAIVEARQVARRCTMLAVGLVTLSCQFFFADSSVAFFCPL